jgi:hypothetical protein
MSFFTWSVEPAAAVLPMELVELCPACDPIEEVDPLCALGEELCEEDALLSGVDPVVEDCALEVCAPIELLDEAELSGVAEVCPAAEPATPPVPTLADALGELLAAASLLPACGVALLMLCGGVEVLLGEELLGEELLGEELLFGLVLLELLELGVLELLDELEVLGVLDGVLELGEACVLEALPEAGVPALPEMLPAVFWSEVLEEELELEAEPAIPPVVELLPLAPFAAATCRSSLTFFTPVTDLATFFASFLSSLLATDPVSLTVPFSTVTCTFWKAGFEASCW